MYIQQIVAKYIKLKFTSRETAQLILIIGVLGHPLLGYASSITGIVQTGGTLSATPLGNIPVKLYSELNHNPVLLTTTTTNEKGIFTILNSNYNTDSIFFIKADLGNAVDFVSILGSQLPNQPIVINELTSVAAAYSMAQFYKTGVIAGDNFGLNIAAGMNDNLVSPLTGQPSPVMLVSPNLDQTNSLRSIQSLANLISDCVSHPHKTHALFELTRSKTGLLPTSTTEALANLARDPGQHVRSIYRLTQQKKTFTPRLIKIPDAWTVTVKVNDSGDDTKLFGGPGNIVFDTQGYAWIDNNVVQGTPNSSNYLMVLQPDGKPAIASPIVGGGILGGGFGITIAPNNNIWVSNFGWGNLHPSETNGSISELSPLGIPISPSSTPAGYFGGVDRAQMVDADEQGNIWIASNGNDRVCVYLGGNPTTSKCYQEPTGSKPFGIQVAPDGSVWVTNTGSGFGSSKINSSIAKYTLTDNTINQSFIKTLGSGLKGLFLDSKNNAWIASGGNNKVYALSPDGSLLGTFNGGGINGPWSVTVDGEDNVWVANFGPLPGNFRKGRVSKLSGISSDQNKLGQPLSPRTGYTLPSAGQEVLLHNGDPLYGPGKPPSYSPLMRVTGLGIDKAGNIWAMNNWKPSFLKDISTNPGGDGVVIFVGLASPPKIVN
jgi:sugar lactone lactonase YvrE